MLFMMQICCFLLILPLNRCFVHSDFIELQLLLTIHKSQFQVIISGKSLQKATKWHHLWRHTLKMGHFVSKYLSDYFEQLQLWSTLSCKPILTLPKLKTTLSTLRVQDGCIMSMLKKDAMSDNWSVLPRMV